MEEIDNEAYIGDITDNPLVIDEEAGTELGKENEGDELALAALTRNLDEMFEGDTRNAQIIVLTETPDFQNSNAGEKDTGNLCDGNSCSVVERDNNRVDEDVNEIEGINTTEEYQLTGCSTNYDLLHDHGYSFSNSCQRRKSKLTYSKSILPKISNIYDHDYSFPNNCQRKPKLVYSKTIIPSKFSKTVASSSGKKSEMCGADRSNVVQKLNYVQCQSVISREQNLKDSDKVVNEHAKTNAAVHTVIPDFTGNTNFVNKKDHLYRCSKNSKTTTTYVKFPKITNPEKREVVLSDKTDTFHKEYIRTEKHAEQTKGLGNNQHVANDIALEENSNQIPKSVYDGYTEMESNIPEIDDDTSNCESATLAVDSSDTVDNFDVDQYISSLHKDGILGQSSHKSGLSGKTINDEVSGENMDSADGESVDIKPDIDQLMRSIDTCSAGIDGVELKVMLCKNCNSAFDSIDDFDIHLKICDADAKKSKICDICRVAFLDLISFYTHDCHSSGEKADYICSVCKKAFKKRDVVFAHLKIHGAKRDYLCEVCQKNFLHKHHLIHHMKCHLEDRPYKCQVCSATFKRKFNLQSHHHTHKVMTDKKFKCSQCDKSFHQRYHLRRHETSHGLNRKEFTCDICNNSFFENHGLQRHIKNVHSGETGDSRKQRKSKLQLKCEFCDMSFFWRKHLRSHMKLHPEANIKEEVVSDDDSVSDVELDSESEEAMCEDADVTSSYNTRSGTKK